MNLTAADQAPATAQAAAATFPPLDIDALCREHRRALKSFVFRIVRNDEDADDIVQSTFLEAFKSADRFQGSSKPSTWLFGIAHNLARNHLRSRFARPDTHDTTDIDDVADILPASNADPAELVQRRDMAQKALHILSTLSTDLQDTFNAVLDTGDTYELAAQHLNIPVGTVRSRLNRIRQHVRTLRVED